MKKQKFMGVKAVGKTLKDTVFFGVVTFLAVKLAAIVFDNALMALGGNFSFTYRHGIYHRP